MQTSNASLVERMIGAAKLDVHAYEAVERDVNATSQALLVVVITALAAGIGSLDEGVLGFIGGILAGIIGWALYAAAAYFVGTSIFRSQHTASTLGEVLRTLGFAQTPRILFVVGFIRIIGPLVVLLATIWWLAATIVALRQSMELSTGRAVGTAIVATLIWFIPYVIVRGILT